ncbi:glycosyltransferase [Kitasatospora sp. NBC_01287]|uniref:glycosyltransferase n=1 Tax=Kitasatospora sp. NBC_01287 TaxID=2903573 RepID=UPI00224ED219|nr:glycosyltransferase [Kitasatospora sp. NBC_01287]MCX4746103.1 glycosyltransferase [Kitasatospora sp. NBC_01287]
MTILHVSQPVDGGVAQVVTDLVRGQRAAGHRVLLACPPGGRLGPRAGAAGAELLEWPARRAPGPSVPGEAARLRRLVQAAAPDLVHLHSAKAGLAGRLALRGRIPTVFQPHAWSFAAATGTLATASTRWERYATRWAAAVLCVSEQERQDGEAAGISAPFAVVPNGVDLAHHTPTERRAARLSLGLDLSEPLAVCVGRLCRQKGQDVLLASWPAVLRRVPSARLALVGGGPDAQALAAQARALPEPYRVHLAGEVADPRPWLAAADLVVLPSRWEGMALAPLEAMAMARPVIVTEVPGAREQLPPEQRETGLVPVEDPAALTDALAEALADPLECARRGVAARAWVAGRHDVRTVVARVSELYQKSITGGQPTPRVPARI